MKKVLLTIMMCVCCLFCFTACDNLSKEYWLDTQAKAQEIFTSEVFINVNDAVFCSNLNMVMDLSADYAELKEVFAPLFTSSISYAYNQYNDLLISPKNNDDKFKNEIKKVNKNLINFEEALNDFSEKKAEYESYITFTSLEKAQQQIELGRLILFKREYLTIIESAFDLSESLFEARRVGYYDFSDYTDEDVELAEVNADCSLAVNSTNLQIASLAIEVARAYNAKEVASSYENYWSVSNNFYETVVAQHKAGALTPAENAKDALAVWQEVYNMFLAEKENFLSVMNKINLKELIKCDNNAQSYAQSTQNSEDVSNVNYFLNFYKKIETLKTYTLNIFE